MKSDLRNLATAEESYFTDNVTYTATLPTTFYVSSTGVTVTLGAASSTGWNATATHQALPGRTCPVFGGSGPAVAPASDGGEPRCAP